MPTPADPEHSPDERSLAARTVATLALSAALPALLAARWSLLAPASALHPRLRAWVDARASSLCGNPGHRPRPLRGGARRFALASEAAAFAWAALLAAALARGALAPRTVLLAAGAPTVANALSALRGEVLHRFSDAPAASAHARQVYSS